MNLPIRVRLALASCAVFLVVIAALEAISYVSVRAAIHSIVDHELETRLAGLDDHLTRHLTHMSWAQLAEQLKAHPAFQPALLRIEEQKGPVRFEGDAIRGIGIPRRVSPDVSIQTAGDAGRTLRVLTVRRRIDGRVYDLALGADLFFSARILGRLWLLMLLSLPAVLLISGGAGYWISGRALAPVSEIIAAARSIDSNRLGERIAVPATRDEIQELAATMNGMLSRIEDSFRRIRHFTSHASHELRTPLAIIRANAEVALLQGSGRASREALHKILKEAERNSALLEDLLQLARADGHSGDRSSHKPVDLRTSLALACADIRPLADERRLALSVACGDSPCPAEADEEQLRRLWLILLDNAVKYTPAGGTIAAAAGVTPEGQSFVAISDTGIGIAPEHRARIFERFYRVDQSRGRSPGGTGLGLAIARHLAVEHHAAIDVSGEPGRGSRFTVRFPKRQFSGNAQVSVTVVQHAAASLDVDESVSA
jgi:heavy metal sensor kinase